MKTYTEFLNEDKNWDELIKRLNSKPDPNEIRTEFPFVFRYTLYRIPTNEELKPFEKYPELTPKQILNEFGYIQIGKGILSDKIKNKIVESIQKLCDLYPDENRYKEALKLALDMKPKFHSVD